MYYYGDTLGNLWVGTDTNPGVGSRRLAESTRFAGEHSGTREHWSERRIYAGKPGSDCMDDQVTVTGIAVNPVADLGDFGLCGMIGEVVYVSIFDSEGCAANAASQVFRTQDLCFRIHDGAGAGSGDTGRSAADTQQHSLRT